MKKFMVTIQVLSVLFQSNSIRAQPQEYTSTAVTAENEKEVFVSRDLVLVNFYTEWCYFGQRLTPIYEQTAVEVKSELEYSHAILARVDCEEQKPICKKYLVSKFPTLKPVLYGRMLEEEFRGSRSTGGLLTYLKEIATDPINYVKDPKEWQEVFLHTEAITANFTDKYQPGYLTLLKVAKQLRKVCKVYVGFDYKIPNLQTISHKGAFENLSGDNENYRGSYDNTTELWDWIRPRCEPLTRELTFETAEELTEFGLPFMVLFYDPKDESSIKEYKRVIFLELSQDRYKFMFLTGNAVTFSHPLLHVDKTPADAPIILIDSFAHMYTFPKFEDIKTPGKLKQFAEDFKSGKLHREFHFGPDPVSNSTDNDGDDDKDEDQDEDAVDEKVQRVTTPNSTTTELPESVFKRLTPSRHRYSFNRDEL